MRKLILLNQYGFFVLFFLFFVSCSRDSIQPTASFQVEFDNIAGDQDLELNNTTYHNDGGEDFTVTRFNYYVSNFKLHRTDGTVYTVPQDSSYFLIREEVKSSQLITLNNVPIGAYDHIEFMVGVDSLRNTMPESKRTGALAPGGEMAGDGMYWAWNSGYIFVKLEGESSFGNPANDKYYYHIGLYGGYENRTVNNTRVVKIKLGQSVAEVTEEKTPKVRLLTDVLSFFDGPGTNLSIAAYNAIMASPNHWPKTQQLADNYQQMFTFDQVH